MKRLKLYQCTCGKEFSIWAWFARHTEKCPKYDEDKWRAEQTGEKQEARLQMLLAQCNSKKGMQP